MIPSGIRFDLAIARTQLHSLLKRSRKRAFLHLIIILMIAALIFVYQAYLVRTKWLRLFGYLLSVNVIVLAAFIARPSWRLFGNPIVIHKVLGKLTSLFLFLHLFSVIYRAIPKGWGHLWTHKLELTLSGLFALVSGVILLIGSMRRLRVSNYKGFYLRHVIFFNIFFAAVSIHLSLLVSIAWPFHGSQMLIIIIPFIVPVLWLYYTLSKRWLSSRYRLNWTISLVETYGRIATIEITPRKGRTPKFESGSTAFLFIPSLDRHLSHPFSVEHSTSGGIRCYVAQRRGKFTSTIVEDPQKCIGMAADVQIVKQPSPSLSDRLPVIYVYGGACGTHLHETVCRRRLLKAQDIESPLIDRFPKMKVVWCMGSFVQFIPVVHVLRDCKTMSSLHLYYDRDIEPNFKMARHDYNSMELSERKNREKGNGSNGEMSKIAKEIIGLADSCSKERVDWTKFFSDMAIEYKNFPSINVVLIGPNPFIAAAMTGKTLSRVSWPEMCIFTEDQQF